MQEQLEEIIRQAVLPYEGTPVAISGGIDSGILAALIKPKFVVSVMLPGGEKYDESHLAKEVAQYLNRKHHIVNTEEAPDFDKVMKIAVKAIGTPTPHFNIYPLYKMYEYLADMGVKQLILGDGPDESMAGYTRTLIINHIYDVYHYDAFKHYKETIDKALPDPAVMYANMIGHPHKAATIRGWIKKFGFISGLCRADMVYKRPEMNPMSDGIAKHFGIENIRPYEFKAVDEYMFNLPPDLKIRDTIYGKFALREIAAKYLPEKIAWRAHKMGGPLYPVNKFKKWMAKGEFDKTQYLKMQRAILK